MPWFLGGYTKGVKMQSPSSIFCAKLVIFVIFVFFLTSWPANALETIPNVGEYIGFLKALDKPDPVEEISSMLRQGLNPQGGPRSSLLITVIRTDRIKISEKRPLIIVLLESGFFDVNELVGCACLSETPLMAAAAADNTGQITELLLRYGANPNFRKGFYSALSLAVVLQKSAVVKALLDGGARPDGIIEWLTLAFRAAESGEREILRLITNLAFQGFIANTFFCYVFFFLAQVTGNFFNFFVFLYATFYLVNLGLFVKKHLKISRPSKYVIFNNIKIGKMG
jgi:hypothetical protein